ncbi:hypothetical protein Tco_0997898 [Tanacetum coccineum]
MTTLKFTKIHNMVAHLEKSAESDRFEQIIDFLNASNIRYALTVNPTTMCHTLISFGELLLSRGAKGMQRFMP